MSYRLQRMDAEGIRGWVYEISQIAGDDEAAHSEEDRLYEEVLRWVAGFAPEPFCDLAREALKTKQIAFERWCA